MTLFESTARRESQRDEMTYDATYERSRRLRVIERWADVGVLERRTAFPIEQAFADRVAQRSSVFFRPVAINNLDSTTFHRELSYLIDGFDSLPSRVDVAFDSTWKAFELETNKVHAGNVTERLRATAGVVDPAIVAKLCQSFPVQSCEYAFKRLVADFADESAEYGLKNRVLYSTDSSIQQLLEYLTVTYGRGSLESQRRGALLLRRALKGEILQLGETSEFQLNVGSRARVLISLFLYTMRNERFHGSSFSPFISSKASLRTYTHPFFAFLASYYLLLAVWIETRPQATGLSRQGLLASLVENLNIAMDIFGAHWEK